MTYGYADNKHESINDVEKMYTDDVTYSNPNRDQLNKLLNIVQSGDTIVIKSLAQLNWGTRNILLLITKLLDKDVNLRVVDLNVNLKSYKDIFKSILDSDRRRFQLIKIANMNRERNKIIKIDPELWNAYYILVKNKSITKIEMAKKLGISIPTFYRRLRDYEKSIMIK